MCAVGPLASSEIRQMFRVHFAVWCAQPHLRSEVLSRVMIVAGRLASYMIYLTCACASARCELNQAHMFACGNGGMHNLESRSKQYLLFCDVFVSISCVGTAPYTCVWTLIAHTAQINQLNLCKQNIVPALNKTLTVYVCGLGLMQNSLCRFAARSWKCMHNTFQGLVWKQLCGASLVEVVRTSPDEEKYRLVVAKRWARLNGTLWRCVVTQLGKKSFPVEPHEQWIVFGRRQLSCGTDLVTQTHVYKKHVEPD
jgi:hypothetical protein